MKSSTSDIVLLTKTLTKSSGTSFFVLFDFKEGTIAAILTLFFLLNKKYEKESHKKLEGGKVGVRRKRKLAIPEEQKSKKI